MEINKYVIIFLSNRIDFAKNLNIFLVITKARIVKIEWKILNNLVVLVLN